MWRELRFRPAPLRALPSRERRVVVALLGLVALGCAGALVPSSVWSRLAGHTDLVAAEGNATGGLAASGLAVAALIALRRFARGASRWREGLAGSVVGVVGTAVAADSVRLYLSLAFLRAWWRPLEVFSSRDRIAPTLMILGVGVILVTLLVAGLAAVALGVLRTSRVGDGAVRRLLDHGLDLVIGCLVLLLVSHALAAYVVPVEVFSALGYRVPNFRGILVGTQVRVLFMSVWYHLGELGIFEFLVTVYGAVVTARLTSRVALTLGRERTPGEAQRRGQRWPTASLAAFGALVIAGVAVAHGRFAVTPGTLAHPAEREAWRRLVENDVFGTGGDVVNAWAILFGAFGAAVALIGMVALGNWVAAEGRNAKRRHLRLAPARLRVLVVVAIPGLLLTVAPLARTFSTLREQLASIGRLVVGHETFATYWAAYEHDLIGTRRMPVDLVAGPLGVAIVLLLLGALFIEGSRAALAALAVGLASTVLAASAITHVETLLLLCGFVGIGAIGVARWDDIDERPVVVGVWIMTILALSYRAVPDLPLAISLAGSTALSFGLLGEDFVRNDRPDDRAMVGALVVPLLMAAVVLARAVSPSLMPTSQVSAFGQALALPLIGLPLVIVETVVPLRLLPPPPTGGPRLTTASDL